MDFERFKTFPYFAAAALVLSALFGLALGGITSIGTPQAPAVPATERPRYTPPAPRAQTPARNEAGPERPAPPVEAPPATHLRTLEPGRVDEMVLRERNAAANASMLLQVEDETGNRLVPSQINLAVNTSGVGWQTIPGAGQPLGEGRVRFDKLYAGKYRIRSDNPNYGPAEEVVDLGPEERDRPVKMVLRAMARTQVTFLVSLPDGRIPESVSIRIIRGEGARGPPRGRFEPEPDATSAVLSALEASTGTYGLDRETGAVPFHVAAGRETRFIFATHAEGSYYMADMLVRGEGEEQRIEARLAQTSAAPDMASDIEPRKAARLEVSLTLNGQAVRVTRADLRQRLSDMQARAFSRREGEVLVWENILSGAWWLCAWAQGLDSPFVTQVQIGAVERQSFDIRSGHVRISVELEAAPEHGQAKMPYDLRVMPRGFAIERGVRRDLGGKASDVLDLVAPEGPLEVRLQSAGAVGLEFDPATAEVSAAPGATQTLRFVARATVTVSFQCLRANGAPVAGVEFLLTTYPAGKVPESQRARVVRGGMDGNCSAGGPAGPVYLMIWSQSSDWNNPDKAFRVDLPAAGVKDLGGVVVAP